MRIWKLLIILILSFLVIFPALSYAADFRFKEERVSIQKSETIDDDLYVGAGDITVEGTINGDLFVFGGQVRVTGEVKENLFVAGGQAVLEGNVGKNLRVAGGNVTVRGKIGRDLLVAGGNVEIDKGAEVLKDVKAAAGGLIISGTAGSVQAEAGNVTLTNTAKINGDLSYTSDNKATIEDGAVVLGKTAHTKPSERPKGLALLFTAGKILSVVVTILISLLFLFVFPNKSEKIATSWREKFGLNLLWGFLFLIAVPVAVVISFITIIGFPLGIGGILLYVILLYLGKILGIISLGTWVENLGKKEKELKPSWLFVILAAIFYSIFKLIPFIGWLGTLLIYLTGLGALVRFDWELVTKLKKDKIF